MEHVPPSVANILCNKLQSLLPDKFGAIEFQACMVAISYCCYFRQGFIAPSPQYRVNNIQSYYSLALQIANNGKIMCAGIKLSSIIKDTKMANIIKLMEL